MMWWISAARDAPGFPQLPAPPQSLLVSKLVSMGELTPCLHLFFQGQWDSSLAISPWPRACSLPSVWLLGSSTPLPTLRPAQDCSLGSTSLQGACQAQAPWAPALPAPNALSHPNPKTLRLKPSFCLWELVPGCTSKLWSLQSNAGVTR